MVDYDDRCVNLPSYSLPISMINEIAAIAEEENRSQSSVLRESLNDFFERRKENRAILTKEKEV